MLDSIDIIKNVKEIYGANNSLGILKDFERVLDELGLLGNVEPGQHELAVAGLGPHVAFVPGNAPAREHRARHTGAGEALEHVVLDARDLFL